MDIDREIAEKVMGWTSRKMCGECLPDIELCIEAEKDGDIIDCSHLSSGKHWETCTSKSEETPLPYSSEISCAMEVEAEMFRRGFEAEYSHRQETGKWWIEFSKSEFGGPVRGAESLPEAICLAALKALEE